MTQKRGGPPKALLDHWKAKSPVPQKNPFPGTGTTTGRMSCAHKPPLHELPRALPLKLPVFEVKFDTQLSMLELNAMWRAAGRR